jgi:hypothetical protein
MIIYIVALHSFFALSVTPPADMDIHHLIWSLYFEASLLPMPALATMPYSGYRLPTRLSKHYADCTQFIPLCCPLKLILDNG